jgi:hypothetical protein
MRTSWFNLVIIAGAFPVVSAPAADLTKIDRTIAKEPTYKGKPKYCLLVFGPEAKFRVWLVRDDDVLYVDRNGNGDLTEAGERVRQQEGKFPVGEIIERDSQTKHTNLEVAFDKGVAQISLKIKGTFPAHMDPPAALNKKRELKFADRAQEAPIIHFNGPLWLRFEWMSPTMNQRDRRETLLRGGRENHLVIGWETPGLGQGSTSFRRGPGSIARKDIHLVAEILFPSKNPGGEPIKVRTNIPAFQ